MLASLKDLDRNRAQQVLSEIMRSLLPSPFGIPKSENERLYSLVLKELSETLQIDTQALKKEEKTKVLAYLVSEISSLASDEGSQEDVKNRLGEKGGLSNLQYAIRFHDHPYLFERFGVDRSEVEDAIRTSDAYIHLLHGAHAEEFNSPLSLYARKCIRNGKESYLLIQVSREGFILDVTSAWIFFAEDIEKFEAIDVLELFRNFVETYGVEVRACDLPWKKLYLYETIPMYKLAPYLDTGTHAIFDTGKVLQVRSSRPNDDVVMFQLAKVELEVFEIAFFYAISLSTYYESLRAHGLEIHDIASD